MNGLSVFFWNTRKILYETCFNSTPLLKLCFANSVNHRKMVLREGHYLQNLNCIIRLKS